MFVGEACPLLRWCPVPHEPVLRQSFRDISYNPATALIVDVKELTMKKDELQVNSLGWAPVPVFTRLGEKCVTAAPSGVVYRADERCFPSFFSPDMCHKDRSRCHWSRESLHWMCWRRCNSPIASR